MNYVEKLNKDITPYAQCYLSKLRYITPKTYKADIKIDTPFYIHDTLLSHLDSDDPEVRQQSKESIKWQLYFIKKYFPNAKLIIHYSPQAYQMYKNIPYILFENVEKYPQSSELTQQLCYDTAHETNLNNLLQHAQNAEIIHLNGRQFNSNKHVAAGSKNDEVFQDRQDVLKKIIKMKKVKIIE